MSPPEEAAGVIRDGIYIPLLKSRQKTGVPGFMLDQDILADDRLEAIVHSHPGGPSWPSYADMKSQIDSGLIWHIAVVRVAETPDIQEEVFSFGMKPELRLDLGYRHGAADCYSLIRGYYAERLGITLPDVPRDWAWWQDGHDLYENGLKRSGFARVEEGSLNIGDVFLARVRSRVVNHAGIWLGDGLILHHIGGRDGVNLEKLPQQEPAERWMKFIDGWIRHQSLRHGAVNGAAR